MRVRLLGAAFVALGFAAVNCGDLETAGDTPDDTLEINREALIMEGPSTLTWTSPITVCYHSAVAGRSDFAAQNEKVQQALRMSWSFVTNLRFAGFGTCPASVSPPAIVIKGGGGNGGSSDTIGRLTSRATNITLPFDATDLSLHKMRTHIIHEFGHAIGWDHEQNRSENFDTNGNPIFCSDGAVYKPNAVKLTSFFDHDSIMSYCSVNNGAASTGNYHNSSGRISAGDIRGAQARYGVSAASRWMDAAGGVFTTLL
jgi:hypothetical protein